MRLPAAFCHFGCILLIDVCGRYWQRKRAAAHAQLQQLRQEHDARLREQEEKEEAERLLDQVSKSVRAGADAKQRAENKRALSARAREREVAKQKAERCGHSNIALYRARDRFHSYLPIIATGNKRCVKKS